MAAKKGALAAQGSMPPAPPSGEVDLDEEAPMSEREEAPGESMDAAQMVLDALASKDAGALDEALRAHYRACEAEE
jgi:hypothetical protein